MCVYVYVYHVHMGAGGGQKRALDLKELKLQAAVSCLMWLLDAELRSSANGAGTLDHGAVSSPGRECLQREPLPFACPGRSALTSLSQASSVLSAAHVTLFLKFLLASLVSFSLAASNGVDVAF